MQFTLLTLCAGRNGLTRSALSTASGFMIVSVNGKFFQQVNSAGRPLFAECLSWKAVTIRRKTAHELLSHNRVACVAAPDHVVAVCTPWLNVGLSAASQR